MKKILFMVISIILSIFFLEIHHVSADVEDELKEARNRWIQAINAHTNDIRTLYMENGGLFIADDFFHGADIIAEHLLDIGVTIKTAQVTGRFEHSPDKHIEAGYYSEVKSEKKRWYYITAWHKISNPR